MKNILVAIDFSNATDAVIHQIGKLACPSSREKLMSFSTGVSPKCFSMCCTSRIAMVIPPYLK